ncbi:MAG: FtsW/RodA/SpoVE family cell cycle protein [Solobacterium sp.]|nr:FtsW/RodA/SpoVE family cell cycle protein [Solobacterium sp.]
MTVYTNKKTTKKHRGFHILMPEGTDLLIRLSIAWLSLFGTLMIASASMGQALNNPLYLPLTIIKQVVYLVGGFIAMRWLATNFKIDFLRNKNFPLLALMVIAALIVCLFFPEVNGAKAWIRVPISTVDVSIQPSEFAKIMTILIIAAYCGDVTKRFKNTWDMIKVPMIFIGIYLFIVVVLQSDLGSMVVIFAIAYICFMIPSHPQMRKFRKWLAILMGAGIVVIIFILTPYGEGIIRKLPLKSYQINRILSSINPFADQYNTGFQLVSGLVAFATGGWTGLGFGNSVRKYTKFPAANTDFILAIVVEELGYIGFLLIFIPYLLIMWRLFSYASRIKSEKAKIILIGTSMYILIHCLFNIGGVTGMIPLTGVPLLMISAGGSSTISLLCAIGIAQAVIYQYNNGEIE